MLFGQCLTSTKCLRWFLLVVPVSNFFLFFGNDSFYYNEITKFMKLMNNINSSGDMLSYTKTFYNVL